MSHRSIYEIDFCCWHAHHLDHMMPVWDKLAKEYKGFFYIGTFKGDSILSLAQRAVETERLIVCQNEEELIGLINQAGNLMLLPTDLALIVPRLKRPLALIQHGAGQAYLEQNVIPLRQNIILDLVPSEYTAKAYQRMYPDTTVEIVGCPKLDKWHRREPKKRTGKPVVAISFHHDRILNPETLSAWPHFKPALERISIDPRWTLIGHGHPYMIEKLIPYYEQYGVEVVRSFAEVMERADVYVCDNSSTLYEFASTDRPVVVLNAPWYRRHVEHGLRFWEHADVGINCDDPKDLPDAIARALDDEPRQRAARAKCIRAVYAVTDGTAAERAAQALVRFVHSEKFRRLSIEILEKRNAGYPGIRKLIADKLAELEQRLGRPPVVAINGGGEHTSRLLRRLEGMPLLLAGVVDRNYEKMDKNLFDGKISPRTLYAQQQIDLIILSSQVHEKEMLAELRADPVASRAEIYALYGDNPGYERAIFNELYFGRTDA